MNTLSLHPDYKPNDPSRRYKGISLVIGLHLLIGWAIVSGTARSALVALKIPLEAVVIQEVIIPPPPPPPPKQIKPPESLKVDAPPPFVPPPDVAPQVSSALTIVSVAAPTPVPTVIAPPPLQLPVPPKPALNRSDIRLACPTQVQPEMPRKALQDGSEGVVKAQALIKEGMVREVTILSGPRVFHAAVKAAMMKYKCTEDTTEILATQEFFFKIE